MKNMSLNLYCLRAYLYFIGELKRGIKMSNNEIAIVAKNQRLIRPFFYFLLNFGFVDIAFKDVKINNLKKTKTYYLRWRRLSGNYPIIVDILPMQKKNFFITLKHEELLVTKDSSYGIIVLSTVFGLLTHFECRFLGLGGIALCTLFF